MSFALWRIRAMVIWRITIADAMFAPVVFRFNTYGVDCQGFAAGVYANGVT